MQFRQFAFITLALLISLVLAAPVEESAKLTNAERFKENKVPLPPKEYTKRNVNGVERLLPNEKRSSKTKTGGASAAFKNAARSEPTAIAEKKIIGFDPTYLPNDLPLPPHAPLSIPTFEDPW